MAKSFARTPARIAVLAGGVGAARFLRGLSACVDPEHIAVIVNTADDEEFYGLHVSPDIDTILYTLAGLSPMRRGWGMAGDTFHCLVALQRFYGPAWFRLGDRDLATHLYRTERLRQGATLTTVTSELARAFGIRQKILPMTNDPVTTVIRTREAGWLPFQRYLVQHSRTAHVEGIRIRGIAKARPTQHVLRALRSAEYIILPPSNPFVSLGPILSLPGVRDLVASKRKRTLAVSPIIGNRPVKGPLDRMLGGLGHEISPYGVARLYCDVASVFLLDHQDAHYASRIEQLGMRPVLGNILILTPERAYTLAQQALSELTQ